MQISFDIENIITGMVPVSVSSEISVLSPRESYVLIICNYIEKAFQRGELAEVNKKVRSSVCCVIRNSGWFTPTIIYICFTR